MKKYSVVVLLTLLFKFADAQQMDTVLFFDYYYMHDKTWKEKDFKNGGLIVYFPNKDSVTLFSDENDTKLILKKRRDLILRNRRILIEGIRLIKPVNENIEIRFKSFKRHNRKNYYLDTLFVLDAKLKSPKIYWQPLRELKTTLFCDFCPSHFIIANNEFAYKKNYKNSYIIKTLNGAVSYEYYLPEGRLVKIK